MKTTIIFIGGLISGYFVGNLKYKDFSEIVEEISDLIQSWLEVTKDFVGKTAKGIEGFDSDHIKINIEAFINALSNAAKELDALDSIEEKLSFIEEQIAKVSIKLIEKTEKIGK